MRICSFLPSGTEIVCALGLEKSLVGVTHECDYPSTVRSIPKVVTSLFDSKKISPAAIDRLVSETLKKGKSLYRINEKLLLELNPDCIVTQDLCQVCAPSGNDASKVLRKLPGTVRVLYLTPKTINEIFENVTEVGRFTGRLNFAKRYVAKLKESVDSIRKKTKNVARRRVFLLEWIDPPYCAGHWLKEMVDIAGGNDPLAKGGVDSTRIPWKQILKIDPEIIVVSPCGYHLNQTKKSAETLLPKFPDFKRLKAFKTRQIYAVDADSYFVRPGPRVVEGVKILAEIFHPSLFQNFAPKNSYLRILT